MAGPDLLTLLAQFLENFRIHCGQILVGVSGGADSVALLRGLHAIAASRSLQLQVAHFDHAIREESAADGEWVRQLCNRWQIPCHLERRTEFTTTETPLAEEAARNLRYQFFTKIAAANHCQWIALGHTADDQVETVLHHVVRGSGLRGLAGIPAIRPLHECSPLHTADSPAPVQLIRPLLAVKRADILQLLSDLEQDYRTDSTNAEVTYTRNRIRLEVLPLLRHTLNPQVDAALLRLAAQASESQNALEFLAAELLHQIVLEQQPHSVRLRREQLASRPLGLLRVLFVQIWEQQGWPRQSLSFQHVDKLAKIAQSNDKTRFSLPGGVEAICRPQLLELRRTV